MHGARKKPRKNANTSCTTDNPEKKSIKDQHKDIHRITQDNKYWMKEGKTK